MTCNRRMFESVVVGYDTYVQNRRSLRAAPPIVAGDELHIDVELSIGAQGRRQRPDHRDQHLHDPAGERVHTCTPPSSASRPRKSIRAIKAVVQRAMMHDVNILGSDESDAAYQKTVRPEGEVRIAEDTTRTPGTPSFDDVKVGDELPVLHARLSRGDLVNYSGVGRRRQPDSLGRGHRQGGRAGPM